MFHESRIKMSYLYHWFDMIFQVVFSVTQSEVFRVPYFQRRRPARERDIRVALANIRYLRLKFLFPVSQCLIELCFQSPLVFTKRVCKHREGGPFSHSP